MSIVFTPENYYEIEPLSEKEYGFIIFENGPTIPIYQQTEYAHMPSIDEISSTISSTISLNDLPPITFQLDMEPEVHHCRCGKWWVIEDKYHIGSASCPSCKKDMCPFQDFSGQPPDWRYGNYGKAKNFDIKRKVQGQINEKT